ncbi:MAG: hypothetical protein LQ340_001927 [Diploschistes diacapsis]|nr:MAG: hypothetical protein LQ340_001927 [Diploschistes diacapsis]
MSKPFKVLISGSGVTGPVAAYWLARASTASNPIHVTVIERASATITSGQGIDVEGAAKEIARRMGLLETIKSRVTSEQGFCGIDKKNRPYAIFEAKNSAVTREIEIMRGELCMITRNAGKEMANVDFQYNRFITNIEQNDKVRVTISKDDQTYDEEYDALIGADGIRSRTRNLMLDPADTKDCVKPMDFFAAFFSVPAQPQDKPFARLQHSLGGRAVAIRPVTEKVSSIYLVAIGDYPALAASLKNRDHKTKRQAWAETFSDVQYGEFPRMLKEMQETDNFYSDQVAQVKLPTWSKGRCALVGDAAYCPSVATGEGTQLAFLGAYVLAGELATNLSDPAAAFKEYEKKLRGFVEQCQQIPFGGKGPSLVCPQTSWGIWALQTALWLFSRVKIWNLVPNLGQNKFPLPDYKFD